MAREELGLAVHQLRGISLQCFGDPPVQLLSGIAQKSPVGCFLHQRVLEGIDRIGRNAALKYQLGSDEPAERGLQLVLGKPGDRRIGSSTPSRPSPGPKRCLPISLAILTASPSQTAGWSAST